MADIINGEKWMHEREDIQVLWTVEAMKLRTIIDPALLQWSYDVFNEKGRKGALAKHLGGKIFIMTDIDESNKVSQVVFTHEDMPTLPEGFRSYIETTLKREPHKAETIRWAIDLKEDQQ